MAAYIIKSWRWKLICLCAWNVNAAHTQTHTGTPFVVVVVGQAGTCVVRVTAWVCVCRCVSEFGMWATFVWKFFDSRCSTYIENTYTTHHTHTKADTHTPHVTSHTHPSHTDTRNRCINCWRRLFDLFLARTVPHTHCHTPNVQTRASHTLQKN